MFSDLTGYKVTISHNMLLVLGSLFIAIVLDNEPGTCSSSDEPMHYVLLSGRKMANTIGVKYNEAMS